MWFPDEMKIAPKLDVQFQTPSPQPNYAALINPFYRKDPQSSFGKHVLTPTLALTSAAAAGTDSPGIFSYNAEPHRNEGLSQSLRLLLHVD
jgi:hypothetical protein